MNLFVDSWNIKILKVKKAVNWSMAEFFLFRYESWYIYVWQFPSQNFAYCAILRANKWIWTSILLWGCPLYKVGLIYKTAESVFGELELNSDVLVATTRYFGNNYCSANECACRWNISHFIFKCWCQKLVLLNENTNCSFQLAEFNRQKKTILCNVLT